MPDDKVTRVNLTKPLRQGNMIEVEKAEPHKIKGKQMPWSVGKPLKSSGMDEATGLPHAGLMDIKATDEELASLDKEFGRAQLHDRISEGVLDVAEKLEVPLVVEETLAEAEERVEKEKQEGYDKHKCQEDTDLE